MKDQFDIKAFMQKHKVTRYSRELLTERTNSVNEQALSPEKEKKLIEKMETILKKYDEIPNEDTALEHLKNNAHDYEYVPEENLKGNWSAGTLNVEWEIAPGYLATFGLSAQGDDHSTVLDHGFEDQIGISIIPMPQSNTNEEEKEEITKEYGGPSYGAEVEVDISDDEAREIGIDYDGHPGYRGSRMDPPEPPTVDITKAVWLDTDEELTDEEFEQYEDEIHDAALQAYYDANDPDNRPYESTHGSSADPKVDDVHGFLFDTGDRKMVVNYDIDSEDGDYGDAPSAFIAGYRAMWVDSKELLTPEELDEWEDELRGAALLSNYRGNPDARTPGDPKKIHINDL